MSSTDVLSQPALVSDRALRLRNHYEAQWRSSPAVFRWAKGPIADLPSDFAILEFPPGKRSAWTYATCCMSQSGDASETELHLLSPTQVHDHIELLTAVAHYHRTGAAPDLGHTINFGRPWLPGSLCDRGFVSLPYLDGPSLEQLSSNGRVIRCLWLIPITESEREFATRKGLEELEKQFELAGVDYLNPGREAVV